MNTGKETDAPGGKVAGIVRELLRAVGEDPASAIYVRNKRRACEQTGMANFHVELPASTSQDELLGLFVGIPRTEQSVFGGNDLPPRILLFQRNLERNALDERTMRELADAFEELAADDGVRGVVLTSVDGALAPIPANKTLVVVRRQTVGVEMVTQQQRLPPQEFACGRNVAPDPAA